MQTDDLWNALQARPLFLDDSPRPLEFDRAAIEQFYVPLAQRIVEQSPARQRCLVAIAGPPGSGKSALAALLGAVINLQGGYDLAAVVGLDGWHYPNAYLDNHALRSVKGAPETYDVTAVQRFIEQATRGQTLRFPIYSRARHDPVPDAGSLDVHHQIVLLEGNYWLLDAPTWREMARWFDLRIFLKAEPDSMVDGLRQRHLRGVKTAEFTEAHIQQVDLPNICRVLEHALPADIIVYKRNGVEVEAIDWHGGTDISDRLAV